MTLTLVVGCGDVAPTGYDAGDRVTSDGMWSLTHEIGTDDDTGLDRPIVVATHLSTGLQLTHDLAGVDDWLMSGVALADLTVQAVATYNGLAPVEDKDAARAALVKLDLLLPTAAADTVEYRCECGGYLALAPGRRLVHVDVCAQEINPTVITDPEKVDAGVVVVCDPADHRICLAPAARICGHDRCRTVACAYAPPCGVEVDDHCGSCCYGQD